jgi:hypothetical protein
MADRFTNFWRFVFDASDIESMADLITTLESFAEALPKIREWRDAGIQVDPDQSPRNLAEGYIGFFTTDAEVARNHGFDQDTEDPPEVA